MEGILNKGNLNKLKVITFDLIALSVIYLVPTISHIIGFPLYYLDPMRLMVFLIIIHTDRKNSYIIAGTLPLVSFLTSSHPVLLKSLIMSGELMINVWLFYRLSSLLKNNFVSALFSIVIAKGIYYTLKYLFVSFSLISSDIIATPLYYQLIIIIAISLYSYIMIPERK